MLKHNFLNHQSPEEIATLPVEQGAVYLLRVIVNQALQPHEKMKILQAIRDAREDHSLTSYFTKEKFDVVFQTADSQVLLDILEHDGIDVEETDGYGNTLLMRALQRGMNEAVIQKLTTNGTRFLSNEEGMKPYDLARKNPKYEGLLNQFQKHQAGNSSI